MQYVYTLYVCTYTAHVHTLYVYMYTVCLYTCTDVINTYTYTYTYTHTAQIAELSSDSAA
jgi:hypothetical protein